MLALLALGACSDPPTVPPDAEVLPSVLPTRLSETGMYKDIRNKTLGGGLVEFSPSYVLWSDGAEKHRWYRLPEGTTIDSSEMDHWRLPVGTKLFKEFALDGKRLETRLIWRVGDTGHRERDTLMGSYVWNETETDAVLTKEDAPNVRGTGHDVPGMDMCWRCHIGEPGGSLGFSALQFGDVSGLPLSVPPPAGTTYAAPNEALGYLHANCGHCHNPNGGAWADSQMVLRLDVGERDAATSQIVTTTVGVELEQWIDRGYTYRIVAGDPDQSAAFFRITQRTMNVQMPPLATEKTDDAAIALLRSWIESL